MLCCLGLFGGLALGSFLGGPWSVIAPIAGFGLGLIADVKLMGHGFSHTHEKLEPTAPNREDKGSELPPRDAADLELRHNDESVSNGN